MLQNDVTKLNQQDIVGKGPDGKPIGPDPIAAHDAPVLPEPRETTPAVGTSPDPSKTTPAVGTSSDDVDWKKRHDDLRRYQDEIRKEAEAAKTAAKELQDKFKRYEGAGIDFGEIDRQLTALNTPAAESTSAPAPSTEGFVKKEELDNLIRRYGYDMAKRDYLADHPEFKDPTMCELLEDRVGREAMKEKQEYDGRVVSSAGTLLSRAGKYINSLTNRLREEGMNKANEKRTKVNEAAMPEGSTEKIVTAKEEDEINLQSEYRVGIQGHRDNIRNPVAP